MNINFHNQIQLSLIRTRYLVTKNLIQSKLTDFPDQKTAMHKELLIFGYSAVYVINDMIKQDKLVSDEQTKTLLYRFDEIDKKILRQLDSPKIAEVA